MFKKIKYFLRGGGLVLLLFHFSSLECKKLIKEDIAAYTRKSSSNQTLLELIFEEAKKPFRNVLYYRFQYDGCSRRLLKLCRIFVRPLDTIEIGGEIDGGLKIIHNYCVISVGKAGKNFTVLQGVTIGKNVDGGKPIIGDNVIVFPNAVIFGGIQIGNDVRIGAGSVINKDVPANSVVVGTPLGVYKIR